ncbi:MAG: ATP-binding protein [candidate division WOR-3 bacterium]|nr:ATP-binding protein [candidate division WOR-3 bacterium]
MKRDYMVKNKLSFLRYVLILTTILVMTYSKRGLNFGEPAYAIAIFYLIISIIISRLPDRILSKPWFSFLTFLFDIIIISSAIYLTEGVQTDFYLIYFLAILISSVSQTVNGSFFIALVASIIYAWLIRREYPDLSLLDSRFLIRIPFLFIISLVSSYWAESTRRELKKKEELERFNVELKKEVEKITAREVELRVYNERIINSVASGIMVVKGNGMITTVNPEAERVLGYKKEEILESNIKTLEGLKPLWQKMEYAISTGKPIIRDDIEILNKNGERIPIGFNITLLELPDKEISGCVLIFKDLSEIRRLEEVARQNERFSYLGKMASWVAHEIRNPLTSIDGFAQLLMNVGDKDKIKFYVEEIRKGTHRINRIIDDILTFARSKKLEFKKVDLKVLIDEIIKPLKVKIEFEGNRTFVQGEEESLRRLFVNLITNSIEAMDENGLIKIKFNRQDDYLVTRVIDNGKGIDEKDLKNIFSPFFTTKPRGTGLGLAIVKKIVDDHKGRVEIQSKPGQGTEVSVWLPAWKED